MLRLKRGKPAFVPVSLGGGAFIRVRPATQTDVEETATLASHALMGLVAGSEHAAVLANVMGDDFNVDALQDPVRLTAAGRRLSEIYLVMSCQDGWTGVATEDGEPIETVNEAWLAILLSDPTVRTKVMSVVDSAVHAERAEKNGSSASPNGGADIPTGVQTAVPTVNPAPSVEPSTTVSVTEAGALRSSSRRRRQRAAR